MAFATPPNAHRLTAIRSIIFVQRRTGIVRLQITIEFALRSFSGITCRLWFSNGCRSGRCWTIVNAAWTVSRLKRWFRPIFARFAIWRSGTDWWFFFELRNTLRLSPNDLSTFFRDRASTDQFWRRAESRTHWAMSQPRYSSCAGSSHHGYGACQLRHNGRSTASPDSRSSRTVVISGGRGTWVAAMVAVDGVGL